MANASSYRIVLDGGKYSIFNVNGILTFERYGEAWPAANSDLGHSGVVLAMAQRIEELETQLAQSKDNFERTVAFYKNKP